MSFFFSLPRRISFKGALSEEEVRDSSVEMLQIYLTSIIESIVGSVDQCPPVMRVAFKQLHKRVEEQFSEPENEVSPGRREGNVSVLNGIISHRSLVTWLASACERIPRLLDLSPLTAVWFAGRQVSGHQRLLFPAFLRAGHPHAQTVPAEGSARRHADEQNAASPGQGGFFTTHTHRRLNCYSRFVCHRLVEN